LKVVRKEPSRRLFSSVGELKITFRLLTRWKRKETPNLEGGEGRPTFSLRPSWEDGAILREQSS